MDALSTANRTQVQFLYTTHNTLFLRDSLFLFSHVKCIVLLFLWICIMRNSTIWGPNLKYENATKFYWNTVLASKKNWHQAKSFRFSFWASGGVTTWEMRPLPSILELGFDAIFGGWLKTLCRRTLQLSYSYVMVNCTSTTGLVCIRLMPAQSWKARS